MRCPRLGVAVSVAGLAFTPALSAQPRCAGGDGPWVSLQVAATRWTNAQRATVFSDLAHTLAGQGIAACSNEAHPGGAPLASVTVEIPSEDAGTATVDIEVRDAVTNKRVRRDLDLSRIPEDGRAPAIAIEADELLRASWAEIALDTARGRELQVRPQVAGSVAAVLAPARLGASGAVGARAAAEYFVGGASLIGADVVARLHLSPRFDLDVAGGARLGVPVAAPHGQVSAMAAGGAVALLVRVAAGRRTSLAVGPEVAASWLEFRAQPDAGAQGSTYDDLLVLVRLQLQGRLALGRSVHGTAGFSAGVVLRGLAATDAGQVVDQARGAVLGLTLGLEAP
ncbi:MAG: hypothetical protein ABUS79_07120 [Pseudomonadota bacterium]